MPTLDVTSRRRELEEFIREVERDASVAELVSERIAQAIDELRRGVANQN